MLFTDNVSDVVVVVRSTLILRAWPLHFVLNMYVSQHLFLGLHFTWRFNQSMWHGFLVFLLNIKLPEGACPVAFCQPGRLFLLKERTEGWHCLESKTTICCLLQKIRRVVLPRQRVERLPEMSPPLNWHCCGLVFQGLTGSWERFGAVMDG